MLEVLVVVLVAALLLLLVAVGRLRSKLRQVSASIPIERKQAVKEHKKESGRTKVGQTIEKLIPMMEEFRYDPSDARFIGAPVDYVIFHGLTEGEIRELVFLEVKSGKEGLTPVQRQVERCALLQQVRFGLFKVDSEGTATLKLSKRVGEVLEPIDEETRRGLSLPPS